MTESLPTAFELLPSTVLLPGVPVTDGLPVSKIAANNNMLWGQYTTQIGQGFWNRGVFADTQDTTAVAAVVVPKCKDARAVIVRIWAINIHEVFTGQLTVSWLSGTGADTVAVPNQSPMTGYTLRLTGRPNEDDAAIVLLTGVGNASFRVHSVALSWEQVDEVDDLLAKASGYRLTSSGEVVTNGPTTDELLNRWATNPAIVVEDRRGAHICAIGGLDATVLQSDEADKLVTKLVAFLPYAMTLQVFVLVDADTQDWKITLRSDRQPNVCEIVHGDLHIEQGAYKVFSVSWDLLEGAHAIDVRIETDPGEWVRIRALQAYQHTEG